MSASAQGRQDKVWNLYQRASTDGEKAAARAALLRMGLDPEKPPARTTPIADWIGRARAASEELQRQRYAAEFKARKVYHETGGMVGMHPGEWMTAYSIVRLTQSFATKPIPRKSTVEKRIRQLWDRGFIELGWMKNSVTPVFRYKGAPSL